MTTLIIATICIVLNAAASWSLGASLLRLIKRKPGTYRKPRVFDTSSYWDF